VVVVYRDSKNTVQRTPLRSSLDLSIPSMLGFFPDQGWDQNKRQHIADELNKLNNFTYDDPGKAQAYTYYNGLSDNALRVLAGLQGNEAAFSQITITPLDPDDLTNADRIGPDDPAGYIADPTLRAYVEKLDGFSANCYFYRSAQVDGAHNLSPLSLSSPPVYLPDLILPHKPRLLKALGDNRSVHLYWGADQETLSGRYLIYRAASSEEARDIRLMGNPIANLPANVLVSNAGEADLGAGTDIFRVERVYDEMGFNPEADLLTGQTAQQYLSAPTIPIITKVTGLNSPDGTRLVVVYRDSKQQLQFTPWKNSPRIWSDSGLIGTYWYYYRIVATRDGTTATGTTTIYSQPSDVGSVRAIDLNPPDPPNITTIEWVRRGSDGAIYPYSDPIPLGQIRLPAVHLVWAATDPTLTCLVQVRHSTLGRFENASSWLPAGQYQYVDPNKYALVPQEYRIKILNKAGNMNLTFNSTLLSPPP
jgi:hypothetical protein